MPEHLFPTIPQLAEQFRSGISTPGELTDQLFSRIGRLDEKLHAFLVLTKERAFREARKTDLAIKSNSFAGPLQGIPFAAKDLFDVQGLPTTAGCRLLSQNIAQKDSAAVQRLSRAGMILLGKTNTVQFAFGGVGINHDQGSPLNPWMSGAYVSGGSSSGSAVAVAAGLVPAALGTDTGGSVRIPASLCGIVGLKTTVGRISRSGVYPLSWTLDSVGVLTRWVEDAALVYRTLQGPDPEDESTLNVPPGNGLSKLEENVSGLRLAFGETIFFDEIDPEIEQAVRETGKVFQFLNARVESLEVPEAAEALASRNRALMIAAEACVVNEDLLKNHFDQLDPIIAQRMMTGWKISAPDYLAELRKWKALQARIIHSLKNVDALLVPTTMIPTHPMDEVDSSLKTYMKYNGKYLRNTSLGNVLNLCAVSVPCGFTREGLPIGLMIYAKPFQEESALRVAYAYEQATRWHNRHPNVS